MPIKYLNFHSFQLKILKGYSMKFISDKFDCFNENLIDGVHRCTHFFRHSFYRTNLRKSIHETDFILFTFFPFLFYSIFYFPHWIELYRKCWLKRSWIKEISENLLKKVNGQRDCVLFPSFTIDLWVKMVKWKTDLNLFIRK